MFETGSLKLKAGTVLAIVGGALCFVVGGLVLERLPVFRKTKKIVQTQSVPSNLLNYGAMGKLLKRLGLVVAVPDGQGKNLDLPPLGPETDEAVAQLPLFQRKRRKSKYLFRYNPGGEKELPSTTIIKKENHRKHMPLLSVVVDKKYLWGKKEGIIANPEGRGGKWERLAYMSYFEDGELQFATAAGLRLHGGFTRKPPDDWEKKNYSFRLYFRDEYGTNEFKPGLLFSPSAGPIKHLVIHNAMPWQLRYTSVIAFTIAERMGCRVPETQAIQFFLNGKPQGYYYLSEHLNKRQWESRLGHKNFAFRRTRGDSGRKSRLEYEKLKEWAWDMNKTLTMEEADKYVKVDNLTRHVFSWAFCGTTDQLQGAAVLNMNEPNPRWYWINWDMDQSFMDVGAPRTREPWQRPGMELALCLNEDWMKGDVRVRVLRRLFRDSAKYREYFIKVAMDVMNHRLTKEYLKGLIDYYESLGIPNGGGVSAHKEKSRFKRDIKRLREFLMPRAGALRQELKEYFKKEAIYTAQIIGAKGYSYVIDGYEEKGNYKGWYFPGQTVSVKVTGENKERFSYWLVNGVPHEEEALNISLSENIEINPVMTDEKELLQAVDKDDAEGVRSALHRQWQQIGEGLTEAYRQQFMYLALVRTVESGNRKMTRVLLDEGARLDVETEKGMSLTTHALTQGRLQVVRFLVSQGGTFSMNRIKEDEQLLNRYILYLSRSRGRKVYKVWNGNALNFKQLVPGLSIMGKQGDHQLELKSFPGKNGEPETRGLSARVLTTDKKGKRRVIFGYEANRNGFSMEVPKGKTVHFIVQASIPVHLFNRHNYFLVRDFDGKWENSEKEFFTGSGWKTYIVSKKIRPGSTRLSMYCSFTPISPEDELKVKDIKIIVTDE